MERSIGLRVYVALRLTAGAVVVVLGGFLTTVGSNGGAGNDLVASVAVWVIALFVGLVVALEGVIVLLERTVGASDSET